MEWYRSKGLAASSETPVGHVVVVDHVVVVVVVVVVAAVAAASTETAFASFCSSDDRTVIHKTNFLTAKPQLKSTRFELTIS